MNSFTVFYCRPIVCVKPGEITKLDLVLTCFIYYIIFHPFQSNDTFPALQHCAAASDDRKKEHVVSLEFSGSDVCQEDLLI